MGFPYKEEGEELEFSGRKKAVLSGGEKVRKAAAREGRFC